MTRAGKIYPDVTDILARKQQGRREAAKRSFAEKIAIVEAMRERVAPLKQARESRRSAGSAGSKTAPPQS
jgi:hypothetical protein